MKHQKSSKKKSLIPFIVLSSIVLVIGVVLASVLPTTCKKKIILSEGISWISYLDDNGDTVKVNMPYYNKNIDALCDRNSTTTDFFINLSTSVAIDKSKLNGIHFGSDWDEMTEAPDYFCAHLFSWITSTASILEINFPSKINSVGTNFCESMFRYLSITLPSFCLPQFITDVGNNFCNAMFMQTSFTSLPSGFCLPPMIKKVGVYFCANMFYNSKIETLPKSFNLKLNSLSSNGDNFCIGMFQDDNLLKPSTAGQTDDLILPSNLQNDTTGNYVDMFKNCTLLNAAGVPNTPDLGAEIPIQRN